ncbi:TPA: hypothetical protein RNS99_001214 [Stenotrophomonas maltophilia]|uniref:hypothetical protein n=1 Tax=Stenotrophomonas maltophilia TaxID=40324 RepID=UPI0011301282|nr:hypothetical protein [Stenotrophomonas maltophilia]HDX0898301.1 hypothetical protein [Stenotrophomonas maltophilia]HDX0916983.1 hypothetical protein [Stenotrophomonas maltophilia]
MSGNANSYDAFSGAGELLEVVAFNPAMSFDEDEEDLVIEQLSVVCRVEYLDADGDLCVGWCDAWLDKNGLFFEEPECLRSDDEESSRWLYESVSDALAEVIDSQVYDLGDTVDHERMPVTLHDAEMTFEMVEEQYIHEIDDCHYVCSHEYLSSDDQGASKIGSVAPFYVVERNSDFIAPIHSASEYVSVVNNLDEEFQRLRLQQHASEVQQSPTEVQRSVQTRRM